MDTRIHTSHKSQQLHIHSPSEQTSRRPSVYAQSWRSCFSRTIPRTFRESFKCAAGPNSLPINHLAAFSLFLTCRYFANLPKISENQVMESPASKAAAGSVSGGSQVCCFAFPSCLVFFTARPDILNYYDAGNSSLACSRDSPRLIPLRFVVGRWREWGQAAAARQHTAGLPVGGQLGVRNVSLTAKGWRQERNSPDVTRRR